MRIIYKNEDGGLAIVIPSPEALAAIGIDGIAQKDVPAGKPYKIVPVENIPTDRSLRNAWTIDDAELTDGIGGGL